MAVRAVVAVCAAACLAACGSDEGGEESGDCTVVIAHDGVDFEGLGSGPEALALERLGDATVAGCDDTGGGAEEGPADAVEVWRVRGYAEEDVLGVRVEDRVDLYFREDLGRDRVAEILGETS